MSEKILDIQLLDNVKSREMASDGSCFRIEPGEGDVEINSQEWLIENRGIRHHEEQ